VEILAIIKGDNALLAALAALFGLVVGSFLNVVIYRLPLMLDRTWRQDCEEFLHLQPSPNDEPAMNLIVPRSRCPQCGHGIRAHENIPVLSYLVLRGRCASCGGAISLRYPAIEALTAIVSAVVAWQLGPSWQMLAGLLLTWALICLSAIDIERQLLPDVITLPFLWLGLFLSLFDVFVDAHASIIGAIAGYLSLWLVYQLFRLLTGKEGMGFGDFKLLALFGAWLGWQMLLPIILMASLVGAIIGTLMIVSLGRDRSVPIPFGPYLAVAGWVALLWGNPIVAGYLRIAGLAS